MNQLSVTNEQRAVARPLNVLVPLIRDDINKGDEAAKNASMPYYAAAGAKMLEAKGQLKHGEFKSWLKRNFNRSEDQCELYMKFAVATGDTQNPAATGFSSLKDFRRRHLGHDIPTTGGGLRQPSWREGVNESIERARREAERLREETLSRQQEREAEQKLGLRLIDIGYKVLVKELHPDKGGSRDVMARLNRVRARLKQHA